MQLELPPGVIKADSDSASMGRYVDTEWVRFASGKPEKIGGYVLAYEDRLIGVPRGMHAYIDADGYGTIGIGTNQKLYSITTEGSVIDITPYRSEVTLTGPFTTTTGSRVVLVSDVAHGAKQGDIVNFSGATAVGGITLNGAYNIENPTTDQYQVIHATAATSGATGGGTVEADYEIYAGLISGAFGNGYGTGLYGEEAYGTPRTMNLLSVDPRYWALDNYGNRLIGSYTNGAIYWFDSVNDERAILLPGSPTDVIYSFVTEERFVMALREGMYLQWPDQDDPTQWTPLSTNTANTRRLASGSKLIAGASVGQGLSLIWTDTSVYVAQYTGGEFIYDTRVAGKACGLIGPQAFAIVDQVAFWMSAAGFHTYSGYVQSCPRSDEVKEFVFNDLSPLNVTKTVCYFNAKFREVWWIYATVNSTEPNRYVMTNLSDFSWANGTLSRTSHASMVGTDNTPIMTSDDGYIYRHETGVDAAGEPLPSRLKTGLIRVGTGGIIDIMGFSPDFERLDGTMELTVEGRDRPHSVARDTVTVLFDGSSEMVDFRVAGRHVGITLSQDDLGGDWRMGVPFLEDQAGGARR